MSPTPSRLFSSGFIVFPAGERPSSTASIWRAVDSLWGTTSLEDIEIHLHPRTPIATATKLGHLNRRRIAALAGLARVRDRGRRTGPRGIGGGRPIIRSMLYLAAPQATLGSYIIAPSSQGLESPNPARSRSLLDRRFRRPYTFTRSATSAIFGAP